MRASSRSIAIVTLAAIVVLGLLWLIVQDTASEPYSVDAAALSGWTIVSGDGEDPWVVGIQPPEALTGSLLRQLSQKVRVPLVAPRHSALPLVLRGEYADALQGVYGAVDIVRMAHDQAVETATFEPVCVGHRMDERTSPPGELFFVAFKSPGFSSVRQSLSPEFPEHAGVGIYNPAAVTPILPIAATDQQFERWWPIQLDQSVDCQAQVFVK